MCCCSKQPVRGEKTSDPRTGCVGDYTPPTEEISAVRRGRGEKIVSDNSKCIRTSEGGREVNFLFPPWGRYGCFLE